MALAGWILGIDWLVRLRPGYGPIRFNAALALLASGCGLWLALRPSKASHQAATSLGFFVFAVGLLTDLEYLLRRSVGIDQLFWNDQRVQGNLARMAPEVAAFFIFAGLFLVFSAWDEKVRGWYRPAAAFAANLMAQAAVLDLMFRDNKLEAPGVGAAVSVLCLSLGMLLYPGRRGPLAPLLNATAGGRILRGLLLPTTVVPLLCGWL